MREFQLDPRVREIWKIAHVDHNQKPVYLGVLREADSDSVSGLLEDRVTRGERFCDGRMCGRRFPAAESTPSSLGRLTANLTAIEVLNGHSLVLTIFAVRIAYSLQLGTVE